MKYLVNPAWLLILLGLALATVGCALKLDDYHQADSCILGGTGLMLLFGALALRELVRWLGTGLHGPLSSIAGGLLLMVLAAAVPSLSPGTALGLALAGSGLAAGGTVWLLVRLNRTWNRPIAALRRKRPTQQGLTRRLIPGLRYSRPIK